MNFSMEKNKQTVDHYHASLHIGKSKHIPFKDEYCYSRLWFSLARIAISEVR